ncbi:MAG: hypothetical protein ACQET5_12540 [Halobacteriota archaeon]
MSGDERAVVDVVGAHTEEFWGFERRDTRIQRHRHLGFSRVRIDR